MGTVVALDAHRRRREAAIRSSRAEAPRVESPVELYFDLADPASYLAAERVERVLGRVTWVPAVPSGACAVLHPGAAPARMQPRAAQLGLPLVAPEGIGSVRWAAMRVAAHAAEVGCGAEFALAALRLAFCGGLDLDDPEILAEAVAAAGLDHAPAMAVAVDSRRDEALRAAGRRLAERGIDATPAVRVGDLVLGGEAQLEEAARLVRVAGTREPRMGGAR